MDQVLQGMRAASMQGKRRSDNLQMLSEDRTRDNQLQFIIWIYSVKQHTIALEESIQPVYEQMLTPIRPLEARIHNDQQQAPYYQISSTQTETLDRWVEEYTMRDLFRVSLLSNICH